MTAAMMLLTTLPLLRRFERMTSARPERHRLVFLLTAGYLLIWGAFGIAADFARYRAPSDRAAV